MQVNGREIGADDFGAGDVILAVHGLGGTSNFWRPVVTAFADQFRVVAPDLPSAGRSEIDPDVSIESLATDLVALLDKMDIAEVHLVGHSMGTIVCQQMAASAPGRVKDMVLLGPLAEPPDPARDAIRARAEAARSDGMYGIANTIADVSLSSATKRDKPNVQGFVREMVLRQPAEAYALSCLALAAAKQADPSLIDSRTLLITGDEDGVAPEANVRKLGEQISGSSVEVLDNCGHWTLTERPRAVIELMKRFYT